MQYDYPAVFYSDGKSVAFHFVDREDWFLCGDSIDDAIDMAVDVLNGALLSLEREGKEIPAATPLDKYASELAQMNAPYRTVQDWNSGKSQPLNTGVAAQIAAKNFFMQIYLLRMYLTTR